MAVPCWSSWKIGDIGFFFQATLDFKAAGSGNIFEVNAAKAASQKLDRVDDVIDIFGTNAKREGIDIAKSLEQDAFALHDRHASFGADVTQAENCGAVGDNRNEVPAAGQGVGQIDIFLDGQARFGNTGRVGKRQIVDRVDGAGGDDFDLAFEVLVKFHCALFDVHGFILLILGCNRLQPILLTILQTRDFCNIFAGLFGIFERVGLGRILLCFDDDPAFIARFFEHGDQRTEVDITVARDGEDAGADASRKHMSLALTSSLDVKAQVFEVDVLDAV